MKRKLNLELLAEALICFLLSALLFYALISGKAADYVHPRINGFLWFSAAALLIISALLFASCFSPKHNARPSRFLLFAVPVLFALCIPAGTVQSKAVSFGNTAGGADSRQESAVIPDTVSSGAGEDASRFALPENNGNGVITIPDGQFADWYQDISQNMNRYEGKTLRFRGQVFRMREFAKDEMVPVRYAMVCCTADLQPCGILCRGGNSSRYGNGAWVWVTGKIKIEIYENQKMPICYVTKIEKAEKAQKAYIYFTY